MTLIAEKEYAYWLSRTGVIGAVKAGKLLECAGSYEAVYNMKKQRHMYSSSSFKSRISVKGGCGGNGGGAGGAEPAAQGVRRHAAGGDTLPSALGSGISEAAAEYV